MHVSGNEVAIEAVSELMIFLTIAYETRVKPRWLAYTGSKIGTPLCRKPAFFKKNFDLPNNGLVITKLGSRLFERIGVYRYRVDTMRSCLLRHAVTGP